MRTRFPIHSLPAKRKFQIFDQALAFPVNVYTRRNDRILKATWPMTACFAACRLTATCHMVLFGSCSSGWDIQKITHRCCGHCRGAVHAQSSESAQPGLQKKPGFPTVGVSWGSYNNMDHTNQQKSNVHIHRYGSKFYRAYVLGVSHLNGLQTLGPECPRTRYFLEGTFLKAEPVNHESQQAGRPLNNGPGNTFILQELSSFGTS